MLDELRIETRYNRVRDQLVTLNDRHDAAGRYLIAIAIQHHHLSIEVDERSNSEVSVTEQMRDSHRTLIEPLDQRRRCRCREERVDRLTKVFGQSRGHDMISICAIGIHTLFQCLIDRIGDVAGYQFQDWNPFGGLARQFTEPSMVCQSAVVTIDNF